MNCWNKAPGLCSAEVGHLLAGAVGLGPGLGLGLRLELRLMIPSWFTSRPRSQDSARHCLVHSTLESPLPHLAAQSLGRSRAYRHSVGIISPIQRVWSDSDTVPQPRSNSLVHISHPPAGPQNVSTPPTQCVLNLNLAPSGGASHT
jgi:hypothetical protein